MPDTWQEIDLSTNWGDVAPGAVLLYNDDDAAIVEARAKTSNIKLRVQRIDGERFERDAKRGTKLKRTASELLTEGPRRAIVLPAVLWEEDRLFSVRNLVGLAVSVVVAGAILGISALVGGLGAAIYWAFAASAAAGVYARRFVKSTTVRFLAPDRLGLTMATIHPYALTLEQGKLWVPPTRGADRRQLAHQRVDAIRTAYLELREDIAYRIESSALFDPKVPATASFEASLVAFDDATDVTPTDQLDALATEVELTFNVAQSNADRLGLTHLPEHARSDARRAGKAARLAAAAATEGERVASLEQVRRILDSLALYYLPTLDERPALEPGPTAARHADKS